MDIDEDDLLYEETTEMIQSSTLKSIEILLKNQPPYSLTRDDIYNVKDAICLLQERLIEASKTILTEEEILGVELEITDGIEHMKVELPTDNEEEKLKEKISTSRSYSRSPSESSYLSRIDCSQRPSGSEKDDNTVDFIDSDEENGDIAKQRHVEYLRFLTAERKFLKMKPVEPFCETNYDKFSYPLGVVYDEITRDWFVCEKNNKLIRIPMNGLKHRSELRILEHNLIRNPSALTIFREGHSVALLCSKVLNTNTNWIAVCKYSSVRGKTTIDKYCSYMDSRLALDFPCRGLARSIGNNIITIDIPPAPRAPRLRILAEHGKQIAYSIKEARRPSFISSYLNRVAISDLGTQGVYLLRVDDSNWREMKNNIQAYISVLRWIDPGKYTSLTRTPKSLADIGHFNFVAGLQFDRNGFLLIGDAGGHTIKLFDPDLKFIHRVSTDFPIPYMSSFCVNGKGQVLMIDLRGRKRFIFAKLRSCSELLPWVHTSHPPKMVERRSFRNYSR